MAGTVIVVDDDSSMRDSLKEMLLSLDLRVYTFESGIDALEFLNTSGADLLITDMRMPVISGIEVLEKALRIDANLPVVVITAFATIETVIEALRRGAFDYIQKPFNIDSIEMVLHRALEHGRLKQENLMLRGELDKRFSVRDIIGFNSGLASACEAVKAISNSDSTVLIRGESGTGKELIARALHAQSTRASGTFIKVNCAALSAGLLESEMFGHLKGAFTGADTSRVGRFELADGGTILLDEISEMDVGLQGKLLRVLQEREFERVGSSEPIKVNVRVLATTNRNLEESIEEGTFRQDLFYRLNVVPIELPPLRERVCDIKELANHFLNKHKRPGSKPLKLDTKCLNVLKVYEWKGNVRELENVMERAVVLSTTDTVDFALLEQWLSTKTVSKQDATQGYEHGLSLEEVERRYILLSLSANSNHRARTAAQLKVSERTLRDKLKRYASNDK